MYTNWGKGVDYIQTILRNEEFFSRKKHFGNFGDQWWVLRDNIIDYRGTLKHPCWLLVLFIFMYLNI